MKSLLAVFTLCVIFVSCSKNSDEDIIIEQPKDYSAFLSTTDYKFFGKLDGVDFFWAMGVAKFQSLTGYENPDGICDTTNYDRTLLFGLSSEDGGKTRFQIHTPACNVKSQDGFNKVFSVGEKTLGARNIDFFLAIQIGDKQYYTNSYSGKNEIEILKTEEFNNYWGNPRLRVWFKIDADLASCECNTVSSRLTDGLLVAEFYGYKLTSKP
jgi:hypothetical protein